MELQQNIGIRIQRLRTGHGLSQEAFGAMLGTTRQTVSKWELGQALPELTKIIQICRLFSVSSDSLLLAAPSQEENPPFCCGIYRGESDELCETEKYALYLNKHENFLCMRLYIGNAAEKMLTAICEHDLGTGQTRYAYRTASQIITNDNEILVPLLGEHYDTTKKAALHQTDTFAVSKSTEPLPAVSEAGIERCLHLWRMGDSCNATAQQLRFYLCTGTRECIFSIRPESSDIYCGASYNYPFALGLMSGGQYFRVRSYADNSAPFCSFFADFSFMPHPPQIPFDEVVLGACVNARTGLVWCLKRYDDDCIVLQGCGDDEYIYRRFDTADERFCFPVDAHR